MHHAGTATPSFTSSQPKPDTSFSQQQSSTRSTSQPSSTYAPATGAYAHLSQPSLSGLLAGKPDGSTEARRLLAFHISVLVLGLVAAVPIGSWSAKAYVMCLRATIIGMVYKIYVMYGMPTLRPLSGLMVGMDFELSHVIPSRALP